MLVRQERKYILYIDGVVVNTETYHDGKSEASACHAMVEIAKQNGYIPDYDESAKVGYDILLVPIVS